MKLEKIEAELLRLGKKSAEIETRIKELTAMKKAAEDEQKLRLINAQNISLIELREIIEKSKIEKETESYDTIKA